MATLKEVYDAFKADGAPLPDTYEEFENYMTSGPNKGYDHRKQWYDAFKADGAPLPDTYEEFSTALFNPATPEQPKQPEYFKLRRGGKDFTVSTDEVNAAGGLAEWAKANPGAPLRVYMQGNKEDGNSFYGHVDLSVAHDRKQKGLKYSIASKPIEEAQTPSHAPSQEPWQPTAQENAAMSRKLKTAQAQAEAMFDESHSRMDDLSEYYNNPSRFGFKSVESKPVINSEAGKLEKTYITPFGERVKGKETADKAEHQFRQAMIAADMTVGAQIRRAEYELHELQRQRMERSRQIAKDAEKADNGGLFSTYGRAIAESQGIQNDKEIRAIDVAIHQKEEQLKNLREESDRQAGKDVGFWRGFGRAVGDIRTWDFGISDAIDAATMVNIDKYTSPDATDGEKRAGQEMLKAIHDNQEVERMYGDNASFWNRAGVMTGYMPSFMLDFALTGGGFEAINVAGKAAARGAVKLVGKEAIEEMAKLGVKEYAKKYGAKGVGRMVENWTIKALGTTADELLIRAPLMTNTVQAGKTVADIIDRKLGDVVVDENGNYDFSNDKTWGSAIWQGEANAIIENYSEMFGTHLDGVVPALAKTFGGKRISGMLARANASSFGKILETTRKHFKALGVSDYFGEVGEEYYGQLWRSMLNLDDAYQQNPDGTRTNLLFTGKFHGDIWGGMALSMGLMGLGKYSISGIAYGSMKHQVNKADKRAAEIFTPDRWEPIRKVIDNTHNEDMGALAEIYVNDPKLSDDERAAVMEYMERSLNLRGNNFGAMAQSRGTTDGVSPDIMVNSELSQSYIDGYEASSSQEMNDAQNMYEYQRQRAEAMFDISYLEALEQNPVYYLQEMSQNGLFTQEEIDAARDYINAKTVRDGIIQRVNDNIDEQIAQSDAIINGRVNQVSGMIQPAVMGLDDRQVYVVGGSLVVNEDGTIDRDASDESIVVRDAVTGEIEFTDPKSIVSAGEAIDPEAERAAAVDNIRQQAAQAAADALNGTLPFNPGDAVQIDLGGGYVTATVLGPAIDEESGAPVEGQVIVQMADGQQTVFTKEQLQAFADAANYERLNTFEQGRAATRTQQRSAEATTPQFALNEEFTILNDAGTPIRGSIVGELDDGTIKIETEEPINGNRVNPITPAELQEMLDTYNGQPVNIPVALGEETAQPMTENTGTVINSSPREAAQTITTAVDNLQETQPQAEQTPLQRIPRNDNGEPVFEQAESPDIAWDALVEFSEGDAATAKEIADTMAEEKRKAFEKTQKQKAKGKTPTELLASKKEIAANLVQAEQEYNMWQQMANVEQRRQDAIRAQQDAERAEIERAELEAAEAEKKRKANIDKRLHDTFEEVKDVPEAVEVLEDLNPHDIYEAAAELLSWQKVIWNGEGGFKSETGYGDGERRKFLGLFASKDKGGMSLQRLAEDPMKQLCEIHGIAYDNQDARNALIDVIGGALTIGDIRNYIANNRINEARKIAEAKRRYDDEIYDDFCQKEYHMSAADVEAYEENLMSNIEETYRGFDEYEYNGYIADEMAREAELQKQVENEREYTAARRTSTSGDRRVQENDTKATGDISWRSDEVLPESRSDKPGRATADGDRPVVQPSDGIESNGTASAVAQGASRGAVESGVSRKEGETPTQNKLFNYFAGPIRDLIELARGTATGLLKKIVAPISERLQQDLASYGIDVSADYKHVIDNNAIRHALKNHGGRQEEKRGQIPLTDADFERIEDVVTNYDSISIEKGKRNDVNIVYSKSYADGTTIFVEEKRDGRKELAAITMWKKKNSTHTDANHNVTPISDSSEVSDSKDIAFLSEKQGGGKKVYLETEELDKPELSERIDISDDDWTDGEDNYPTYKRTITIDGKHKVIQVDEPDSNGFYTGSYFEFNGGRFGDLSEVISHIDKQAKLAADIAAAESEVNTEPTPGQKEAGNYKKGHVTIGGFDITIENPAGSVRKGVDDDGKEWSNTMANTYGYIRGTEGVDGDHIDVFFSTVIDAWNGRKVFVVDQTNTDGSFDEHKVMLGFNDKDEAMTAYLANYDKTWADTHPGLRISETNIEDFNKWVQSSHRKTKPFADYTAVSKVVDDAPVKAELQQSETAEAQPLSLEDMRDSLKDEPIVTPTEEEQPKVGASQPEAGKPVNPSGNKLVTDERYAELRERMRKKLGGQLNMGVDPEILAIGTEMAVYHIEKGARKFKIYASAMIADLGDAIRPYLKAFYNAVRDMPEAAGLVADMDSYDEVRNVDIANFDKSTVDAMATAAAVVAEQQAEKQREEAEKKLKEQRKKRLNPDGSITETIVEGGHEIAITVGDFIPGVRPSVGEGKKKPGKKKTKPVTDGGLFYDVEDEVPTLNIPEHRSTDELAGDSATYQAREAQTVELVAEIGGVIESRVKMLQLDAESVKPLAMTEVKKMASKYSALNDISDTDLQELVELAMTQLTRSEAIINIDGTAEQQRAAFDHIVNLYQIQPSLNARDSERLIKQQYSTPTPFGYVMGQFVRAGGKTVGSMLEPSAGNGALTITVHPSLIRVNDIDEARLANLRKLGYGQVTAQDALLPFTGDKVDVVMTNPPFGTVTEKEYDGIFHVSSLEAQMAINALEKMKDDGRAAIVIGGNTSYRTNGSMNPKDAAFFGYLYSHYNVSDVINISGKALYSRNGTGYDVRMILIDGRKTGEFQRVFPPVKAKARAEQVTTFDELYKRVQDDIQQIQQVGSQSADVQREPETTTDGTASAPIRSGSNRPNSGAGQRPGTTSDAVRDTHRTDSGQSATVNDGNRPVGVDNADTGDAGSSNNVPQPKPQQPRSVGGGSTQNGTGRSGSDGRGATSSRPDSGTERLAVKPDLTTEKVPYPNQSGNGFTLMSVVPAAQAQVLQKSLGEIGDVDKYLVDELGYSSKEELYGYLAAEQIDSVALAIHQMNKGNAFIIGDMTGVGKGRQGAALIRYAVKQGKVPIYFTQKPTLFTDNYRDLADIGSSDLRPFIIASNPKDANIVDADGNIVHKLPSKKEQERVFAYIMEHGTLPDEYDYVLTTYDQIKNGTGDYAQNEDGTWNTEARKLPKKSKGYTTADYNGQTRRDALAKLAEGNIAILDESHTVGGDSGCGRYMQMLTSSAGGVTFLSATFAKRADNMPIYAQRTAIAEAEVKASELIDAIMKGGVTLQEIMSKQLVESGQMIRRERSFEGVTIDWLSVEEETDRRQRAQFDEVAAIFNAIRNFQDDYITPIIDAKNEAAAEWGATVDHTQGTKDMGVKNVPFASKMYNLVNQLLFALKVDAVADRVVESLRNGYKPVISFTNTMEGFLSSAPKGVAMDEVPNFSLTLMRALDGVMRFTEKDADENTEGGSVTLGELSADGQKAYNAIRDKIMNLTADLPISPMDAIRMKIEEAGYSVAEITGRTMQLNRTEDGKYIVEARKDRDKKAAMRDFNSGKLDVLMINKSGSTGISLHASSKFEDQRQRVMVFAQFQSDINDEVQMRGRIDRSGQVTRGRYEYIMSTIPAEQRIQMMFKAKLKSLDANTTSSQKSKFNEMEIVDYLNKYGDEVVWEYMKEHPELEERLGDPLDMLQEKDSDDGPRTSEKEDTSKKTGCAGKISRYLAFLSVDEQDEIFKEITEAYRVKIQLLDDAGENDLEITTMPLRADTKRKQIWHEGVNPGSGNAFADNTYVEEVEVDVLKKPMKRDEVTKTTRKLMGEHYAEKNGMVDWQHYISVKDNEISQYYQTKVEDAIGKLKEAGNARVAKAREKTVAAASKARSRGENNFTDAEIQSLADAEAKQQLLKEEWKQRKRRDEILAVKSRITSLLHRLIAEKIYVIPQDLKQGSPEMFSQTFGTFVGFKFNKSYTLGSSTAIFATLDGRRKVELALSDPAINTIISATEMVYRYSPKEINAITMENWDKHVPTQSRQKRYIISGNLLQALVDTEKGERTRGNLISYSTIDGETRQGILMGENFKLTDLRNSVSFSSRLAQIREGKAIVSENGDVQIEKISFGWQHRGEYELRVPKSKQRGGIYTMHPDLLKLVEDRNFITKGNNMVAYVTEENIAKVVDMLSRAPFNLTVLQESQLSEVSAENDDILYRTEDDLRSLKYADENSAYAKVEGIERLSKKERIAIERYVGNMPSARITILTDKSNVEAEELSDATKREIDTLRANGRTLAVYCEENKKIYIFAAEGRPIDERELHATLFHENVHAAEDAIEEVDDEFLTDFVKGISQLKTKNNFFEWILERVKELYPSEEVGSEYLAYCLEGCKGKTNVVRRMRAALSERNAIVFDKILTRIYGESAEYKTETVDGTRNRQGDNNARTEQSGYRADNWRTATENATGIFGLSATDARTGGGNQEIHGGASEPLRGRRPDGAVDQSEVGSDHDETERQGDGYGAYSDEEVSYLNDPISIVLGKNRFSKKRQAEFAARERQRMADRIQELAKRMHLDNVEIVTDASQLDGKRATAKGFFNKRTGKITIVIPNNVSTLDAMQTLLHEGVAHYGLRQLFGSHFDTFLDNVYEAADESVRRKIAELAAKNGWDFRTATEEYLAGLAEEMNFEQAKYNVSWWAKIKSLFIDMLEHIGFEGFRDKTGIVLTDNELRYLLWRSYENLAEPGRYRSILGEAKDIAKQAELKVGNYAEQGIEADYAAEGDLYRPGDFSPRDRVFARYAYESMVRSGNYQFQEAVQDSMLGLKTLYQAVLGKKTRIEDVSGFENAYLFENRMSSMNAGEQHEYFQRYMQPLLKEIGRIAGANKRKRRELTDYIMAKHGLERNEYMRNEAADNGEKTDRDFAGLMGLTGEADWQSAEATAQQWVDDYEDMVDTTDLWKAINNATKATLEKIYLSGIISKETYEKILGMYSYYIPLRGWNETTSEQVYGYLTSKDGPLGGSIMKKAEGRESMADDPIATIGMMADDAIRQGNRNLMKQRFLNFVLNHPSDAVSVHDIWLKYDDVVDDWRPVFADVEATDTAEEVAQKVEAFEQRMEAFRTADPDKYKKGREAQHIPYKVVKGKLREHQILIKRNGRTFVATINGNPRAAQALNGLTNPDVDQNGVVGDILKAGTWINRQLSAFYTTRNPEFVVSNFFRDALYSNCMMWVKESPRYALHFHKNFGRVNPVVMRRLLGKWENGKLDMSNRLESLFYQFMKNGGETGYTNVRDIESHKKTIAAELKKQGNVGRKAWSALGMQLDLLNRSAENCARFAAFMTSRDFGRSIDRSIYDAKEVSVNFNKKGSGGKMVHAVGQTNLGKAGAYLGGGGRVAFVFWNAGIQGMTNAARQAKLHPAKFTVGATAMFSLGYVIPMLAQMLGGGDGDDDDKNAYYNLPEYVRRSNICFRAGEQWITIPLPIEYRAMYGLGELAHGVISGNERYSDDGLGRQILAQFSQIMPLDMLEGGGGISPFIPSAAKPFTEAYIMNKSWTGLPVYKDTPFNKNDPEWTKAYASADKHLVDFAKWLNETSGGDDFTKGAIDINPAKIEYILNGYFGGLFTFPNKVKKAAETAFGDRDFEWRNIPIANRLIKSGDERTANRKLQNEYFKYLKEYEETGRRMRKYENANDNGILGYAEKINFLENSPEYARWEIFDEFKSDIDAYREDIATETDKEEKSKLEAEMFAVMRELVNALHNPEAYINSNQQ